MSHIPAVRCNGMLRRVFDDYVQWIPEWLFDNDDVDCWLYAVYKLPFVPGFHLCRIGEELGDDEDTVHIISTHKTLAEAMGVCKVLLANGGVLYV